SGLSQGGFQAAVAAGGRRHALLAILLRLWSRPAEDLLRLFPQRRGYGRGQAAAGTTKHPASMGGVGAPRRAVMSAREHAVDEVLPQPREDDARDREAGGRRIADLRGHWRWSPFYDAAARRAHGDHWAGRSEDVPLVRDERRRRIPCPTPLRSGGQGS